MTGVGGEAVQVCLEMPTKATVLGKCFGYNIQMTKTERKLGVEITLLLNIGTITETVEITIGYPIIGPSTPSMVTSTNT